MAPTTELTRAAILERTADRMLAIPAGTIALRDERTKSNWTVELGDFLIAPHPVTRWLHAAITHGAEAPPTDPHVPATDLSWIDAIAFCNALSRQSGLEPCYSEPVDPNAVDVVCNWKASGYRLPSEAEWEYACRAGTTGVRYGELDAIAWYYDNSGHAIHEVGTKQANAWGLYDTIGNVWEWCWDVYDPRVYGPYRVFRGGGWYDHPRGCRASCRRRSHPTFRIDDLGLRLARSR